MRWIPPILVVLAIVLVVRRMVAHAVDRGWIYGRHNAPKRGNAIGSLSFDQVFNPAVEHVLEEQRRLQIEADHHHPSDGGGTEYGGGNTEFGTEGSET